MEPAHQSIERPYSNEQMIQIAHAVEGYKLKHQNASQEEIDAFVAKVSDSIFSKKAQTPDRKALREERKQRRAAVVERIKASGLKVVNVRATNHLASMVAGRAVYHATGGLTIAFKEGETDTTVSMAICSFNDPFDNLEGRELAVNRFLEGVVLTQPGKLTDHPASEIYRGYMGVLRQHSETKAAEAKAAAWPFPTGHK